MAFDVLSESEPLSLPPYPTGTPPQAEEQGIGLDCRWKWGWGGKAPRLVSAKSLAFGKWKTKVVLRKRSPSSSYPLIPDTVSRRELATSQNSRNILAGTGCRPGIPGAARQGGVSCRAADGPHTQAGPGHPVLGRGPNRLCLQNVSTRVPSPTHHFPWSWGWGRGRADPEGAEACKQLPPCPRRAPSQETQIP